MLFGMYNKKPTDRRPSGTPRKTLALFFTLWPNGNMVYPTARSFWCLDSQSKIRISLRVSSPFKLLMLFSLARKLLGLSLKLATSAGHSLCHLHNHRKRSIESLNFFAQAIIADYLHDTTSVTNFHARPTKHFERLPGICLIPTA